LVGGISFLPSLSSFGLMIEFSRRVGASSGSDVRPLKFNFYYLYIPMIFINLSSRSFCHRFGANEIKLVTFHGI
ncbi:MAG: hypothetical protein AB1374_12970, partial [Bacillota bacterium]